VAGEKQTVRKRAIAAPVAAICYYRAYILLPRVDADTISSFTRDRIEFPIENRELCAYALRARTSVITKGRCEPHE